MALKNEKGVTTIVRDSMSRRDFIKAVGLVAGTAGVTLILPSCAQKPEPAKAPAGAALSTGMVDTSKYKKNSPWKVGRSGMGEVNSWQVIATLHFTYGIQTKYKGMFGDLFYAAAKFDPAKQVADMEDILTHNIDVLFCQPVTGGNCVAQIEQAMSKGIPVILPGARAYTDKYVSYLDRDNAGVGRIYAEYIGKKLDGKGNVAIMMGLAGNTYAEDVLRGAREGLAKFPKIKDVGLVYGAWSPVEGKKAMQGLLGKKVKIDGIINDGGNMGIGIVDAFLDAKLPVPPMCGDDGNGWLRKAKENQVTFLSVQGGAEQYLDAVDTAVKTLKGEPVAKNVLADIITFEEKDLDKYYRPDLNDQYWAINKLPEDLIVATYKKK
jgi:ribose transport system substrate-binding protein